MKRNIIEPERVLCAFQKNEKKQRIKIPTRNNKEKKQNLVHYNKSEKKRGRER